ncbi:MAG: NAD-dependent epimerase/dehydratase family protein [Nostoc sp.]|uniref:NAD-dependent epimerase/dehydratase family protein n=1 Tax=Nostoc sp. TaxID=1180 RepID=UPI002FF83936
MTNDKKIWLITGVSRGLGKALARAVLDRGDIVIGTTRNGKTNLSGDANSLHLLKLELTDPVQIKQTIEVAYQLQDLRNWLGLTQLAQCDRHFIVFTYYIESSVSRGDW